MSKTEIIHSAWLEKWPAPAKINLMLRITGRRDDGYHSLQTVFQLLDLCDWLTFHPLDEDKIYLKSPLEGVPEATDLTIRAAKLLKEVSGYQHGIGIDIEKNLPMGGGLGGGSSDAATTLLVLNKLWGLNFSITTLMKLGLQLGADVPVFIYGYSAWAEGVGEELTQLIIPEQWVVIIKPDCHVNTGEIFSDENLTRDSKVITIADFLAGQQQNDCLSVVRKLNQPIEQALSVLSEYSEARLTGTGACVFAQFDSYESARNAYQALKPKWQVYLSKGMNESLLNKKLALF
ncbi:MAG: 4-(cytidine 5'-diphospho)-2-C-methyl-D-erythritol kinase [Methylococcales bacterium]|nr:4-(cytidine 5'-diphospho)-2-C-methyl-D-erythritol kinase [Methylococcales bacterium]